MPTFPGGNGELALYIQRNMKIPGSAIEYNEKGKTYVKFAVDTSGKVISKEIVKSSNYKWLDDEALRLIGAMPNWNPGFNAGKKVNVYINLPISYGGHLKTPPKTN